MTPKTLKHKYKNILLIDDVALDNFVNQEILKIFRFAEKIYVKSSAESALAFLDGLVANHHSSKMYPDVIFIDINMPLMNGFEFIEAFKLVHKNHQQKPKLVILTSSVFEDDKKKTTGISEEIIFLNKPLTKEGLDLI